jgi:hypothetical protein
MIHRSPAALLLATLAAACSHESAPPEGRDGGLPRAQSSSAPVAVRASASAVPSRIEALARAARECTAYESSIDSSCPAMRAWSEVKEGFDDPTAEASLTAMLADGDEKVRYLGAFKLRQSGSAYRSDRALAEPIVAAAEKEKSKLVAFELGSVVGHLRVRETFTFDRIAAIVKKHALREVRRGILDELLLGNPESDRVYELVREAVRDPDPSVASTALHSFWMGGSRKPKETCQLYADTEDDHDDDLAAEASNALSWSGRCESRYDTLLTSLERRAQAGASALTRPAFATAARHVCEDGKATDAQRQRAAKLGRSLAGNKDLTGSIRTGALETVLRCDGAGGRAFVGRFRGDADKAMADRAKELLAVK